MSHRKKLLTSGANKTIVSMLLIRQDFKCYYCGRGISVKTDVPRNKATLDHRVPLAFGGEPYGTNIVAACHDCNHEKGPLDEETFLRIRGKPHARYRAVRDMQEKLDARPKSEKTTKELIQARRESMVQFQIAMHPVLDAFRKNNASVG